MPRRIWSLMVAFWLALLPAVALAGILTPPSGLTEIGEEAFAGMTSVTDVTLPEGLCRIGASAFSGCASLGTVYIPTSVDSIADDAFSGCPEDMLIYTSPGSYAMTFAQTHGADYDAGGVCRALVIGQSYEGNTAGLRTLEGPIGDAEAFASFLQMWGRTMGTVSVQTNLTGSGILTAASACFAGAQDADISIFYYGGHGMVRSGESVLVGMGGTSDVLSASDLYGALSQVRGRVVVIVDACYSGGLIPRGDSKASGGDPAAFVSGFVSPFASGGSGTLKTRSALTTDRFFVMASSAPDEQSYEDVFWTSGGNEVYTGLFSYHLMLGCGFDAVNRVPVSWAADQNGNAVITFTEAFGFARDETSAYVAPLGGKQNAVCWPDSAGFFGLFRY